VREFQPGIAQLNSRFGRTLIAFTFPVDYLKKLS